MSIIGKLLPLTQQAQCPQRGRRQAKAVGQCRFKCLTGPVLLAGVGEQPLKAGSGELAEGELVGRFGPDKFGYEQSQAHGG